MSEYNHLESEKKWQAYWEQNYIHRTGESRDKKFYILDMFPYPSGEGLHVGHPKGYIATDIYSRMKRMQGYDVLHPMGFDAFGLPAEQYAIKNKVNPNISTAKNVARYKEQLQMLGLNYDWEREINTTDPAFYKWTQWMWKQMWKKGLAYESYDPINWCPSCKTGLANEDLENGLCERCGSQVEKKPLRQWTIRITDYADRLLADLDKLDWEPHIKELQRNWIGKSKGSEINFSLEAENVNEVFTVFTTRADTLFGCTYTVLAPEHALVDKLLNTGVITNADEVQKYRETVAAKSDMERTAEGKEKTGVVLGGVYAVNPANATRVPVYIADYVLASYGTGAIMAVPAHDERDSEFAEKFGIEKIRVVASTYSQGDVPTEYKDDVLSYASKVTLTESTLFTGEGILINSGTYDGLTSAEARVKITEAVGGRLVSKYKLREWVFARQRYWGEPFPIVFDENHKAYAVADSELPVILPPVESYEPTGTGESPLAAIESFVDVYGYINDDGEFVSCDESTPEAKLFKRETNTMPQWAGSSWYYLRYIDPHNTEAFIDKSKEFKWSPVDFYVGGAEHATRHLIYARFWHKFLFDLGLVHNDEPFTKLQTVGLIMAEDGRKMSKRWGNIVNPDDVVREHGADTLRLYEMFMGPFDQSVAWSTNSMMGVKRFLDRVYRLRDKINAEYQDSDEVENLLHVIIKKVGDDIQSFKFNTAISSLMILLNTAEKKTQISTSFYQNFVLLIAPFAPHMAEEIWQNILGERRSIHISNWPEYQESKLLAPMVTIAIQVNGKLRATKLYKSGADQDEVLTIALMDANVSKWVSESKVKKIVFVSNKLLNIVLE